MSFLNADYAAVEARIYCWLCGQEDALREYRQGVDRYKRMATVVYGIPEEQVNKHPQRFVGKQCILGCGFGMGPAKFRITCKKMGGYDLPPGLENTAVESWRGSHKNVVRGWADLERAAKNAIVHKGQTFKACRVEFFWKDVEGLPFLFMRLPSGRKLAYPRPRIRPHQRFENRTEIVFFGHILGTKWGDVSTWGGTFLENATQAVAADVMINGIHNAEKVGYETAALIHDEALDYYYPERGQTIEEFIELLTDLPVWGDGLPIEAEGQVVKFYKK